MGTFNRRSRIRADVAFDDVADSVGVEEVANRHLEQISFLWRQVSTFGEEIIWHFTRFQKLEEVTP
jgi:hypothetical protein